MKVLLVDDHPLVLAALQTVIRGVGPGTTVVGVENAEAARQALASADDFDLVLLDLTLGEDDGFAVLLELRERWPAVPVVVISASERASDVIRAIDHGAMGFVPKKSSHEELHEALAMVMTGAMYVPPSMLRLLGSRLGGGDGAAAKPGPEPAPTPARSLADIGLTPRQAEVMSLLLKGLPNKLIARQLNLSVETVKDHVAAVLRALGVSTRTQAVLAVNQLTQQAPRGEGAGTAGRTTLPR